MTPQPLITVDDIDASRRWYSAVLGLQVSHGGPEYERMMDGERLALQLHAWDTHGHAHLGDPAVRPRGNGALLWFCTDDFDALLARIAAARPQVLEGPQVNPNAHHREIWLRDPDGYVVVVAGPPGDLG